ncbi:class I SAM-dependent methyltransferase [Saccharopolyspora phatthalungensis]|uniref:SAM-dependent methyltransferase n=1 Tax=Saccharopolyspora phatthalungensis TaxID=664693 RepID=A0A840Q2M0_9PSEU|nr:class I SAM-dependent methyltransferase [Saccharopolyspora phatthalungensis]MBB5153008.1 SAM-dependent methyltransferase [Saccharopolyspora phatthalungensis]
MSGFAGFALHRAFGHPSGLLGALGGALMARGNAAAEQQVVRLARLTGSEQVLVIGPGPGVGLRAAGEQAASVVAVEPSARMRQAADRRCADLPNVVVRGGTAEATGQGDAAFDVVLSVNNVQLWPDRAAALAELRRVLRPGGILLLSTHERWLPGGRSGLHADVQAAGFTDVQTWAWQPPTRGTTQAQTRAVRT